MIEGILWVIGFVFLMSDSSAGVFCNKVDVKPYAYYKCTKGLQIPVLKPIHCPDDDKEHSCGVLIDTPVRFIPGSITISM